MELSEKLYKLRKDKSWSQEELAEKMEVSRQTVSKWESNKAIPELNKFVKLSELYNITLDELVKDAIADEKTGTNSMSKKKCKKMNIKILIFLLVILLIAIVAFALNTIRRISILNDISNKYKSEYQSIGESKSGRIVEHITRRDINNIEETHKDYLYYVSENGERLLKVISYEDEYLNNPIEEVYIDLAKENNEGLYNNVTRINVKDRTCEIIEDYKYDSPILKTTNSLNNYYGIIWAWDEIPFYSAKETVFDFNNKFARMEDRCIWNNAKINGSKDNIAFVLNNSELYLYFDDYQDDMRERREIINIQMNNIFKPTKEDVIVPEI